MKLEEVLPEYHLGRPIRRKAWKKGNYIDVYSEIKLISLNANDWELLPKPPVTIDLVEDTALILA